MFGHVRLGEFRSGPEIFVDSYQPRVSLRPADWCCGDRRRFARCVSNVIPPVSYAEHGVLCRLRDDWRPDDRRRFTRVLSLGVPRRLLALFAVLSRRREARLRFANVMWNGVPGFLCWILYLFSAYWRLASRRSASVSRMLSNGILRLLLACFGVLSPRHDASGVSNGIPRLVCSESCLVSESRRSASRRSVSVFHGHVWRLEASLGLV
jgi:hypothetical protein